MTNPPDEPINFLPRDGFHDPDCMIWDMTRDELDGVIKHGLDMGDFDFKFWHAWLCLKGLRVVEVETIVWYRGKVRGVRFGLYREMSTFGLPDPRGALGFPEREVAPGSIKIVKTYTFPIAAVKIGSSKVSHLNWRMDLEDVIPFVEAMLNPRLLPLCLNIRDEEVQEIVRKVLSR